jgi:hypothetical protein
MTTQTQDLARRLAHLLDAEQRPPLGDLIGHLDYIATLEALRGELDDLIAGEQAIARAHGASWLDIGNSLGVTRQAAHQRYGS